MMISLTDLGAAPLGIEPIEPCVAPVGISLVGSAGSGVANGAAA